MTCPTIRHDAGRLRFATSARRGYPDHQISQAELSRVALPILEDLGLVKLINPADPLPEWLRERERKVAMRGGRKPIWMPEIEDGKNVWPNTGQKVVQSRKPAVH
jgi:hypothetical protein